MECDMDMSKVKQKTRVEIPSGWNKVIEQARKHPEPFKVIPMTADRFYKFTEALKPEFRAKCPTPTQPIRVLQVAREKPKLIMHRNKWNGSFDTSVIVQNRRKGKQNDNQGQITLESSYNDPLPLSKPKFQDLQVLKKFVSPANQEFYSKLPFNSGVKDDEMTVGTLLDE